MNSSSDHQPGLVQARIARIEAVGVAGRIALFCDGYIVEKMRYILPVVLLLYLEERRKTCKNWRGHNFGEGQKLKENHSSFFLAI